MLDGVSVPRPHGPGPCRLNAATSKSPIGLLASWLLCASTFSSQEDHCNARAQTLVGILDYDARRQGRERLQHSEMEDFRHCSGVSPTRAEMASLRPSSNSHLAEEAEVS